MTKLTASRVLVISIDGEGTASKATRSLGTARAELLGLLQQHQVPATWALGEVSLGEAQAISAAGHELALSATAAWASRGADRASLAEQLAAGLERSQTRGVTLSTLAIGKFPLTGETDLLVKRGISAIRTTSQVDQAGGLRTLFKKAATPQPRPLRFGLWDVPATHLVAGRHGGKVVRQVQNAVCQREYSHLTIDAVGIAEDNRTLREFRRLLVDAKSLRALGQLRTQTVASLVHSLQQGTGGQPARSILKAA